MKQYQMTFNVPDDFDPEEMIMNVQYEKGEITIEGEGFYEDMIPTDILNSIDDFLKNDLRLVKDAVKEGDVVRMVFTPESARLPFFGKVINALKVAVEETYEVPCIAHMSSIDVLVESADEAIDMLNKMIAKIKVRSAVKDTSSIVLPN